MKIRALNINFSICKVHDLSGVDFSDEFLFIGKTDEEISVVCQSSNVPCNTTEVENAWRAFRIEGVLDFSLIGVLASISKVLADCGIGIFVVSTYNTDYVLVKKGNYHAALDALAVKGYSISKPDCES